MVTQILLSCTPYGPHSATDSAPSRSHPGRSQPRPRHPPVTGCRPWQAVDGRHSPPCSVTGGGAASCRGTSPPPDPQRHPLPPPRRSLLQGPHSAAASAPSRSYPGHSQPRPRPRPSQVADRGKQSTGGILPRVLSRGGVPRPAAAPLPRLIPSGTRSRHLGDHYSKAHTQRRLLLRPAPFQASPSLARGPARHRLPT